MKGRGVKKIPLRTQAIWIIISVIVILAIKGSSSTAPESAASSVEEHLIREHLSDVISVDLAEIGITDLIRRRLTLSRTLLPDGWVEVWLRISGTVTAGVHLDTLSTEDLSIQELPNGSLHATLVLPLPEVTSRVLRESEWGWDHSYWVWAPGRIALQLREEIREQVYSSLEQWAIQSGLLDEAGMNMAIAAEAIFCVLGIKSCEIILQGDQSLVFGTGVCGGSYAI